jgi:hypothetical protein
MNNQTNNTTTTTIAPLAHPVPRRAADGFANMANFTTSYDLISPIHTPPTATVVYVRRVYDSLTDPLTSLAGPASSANEVMMKHLPSRRFL